MAEEKVEKATKIKRKKWIQILAPKSFGNEVIGEIYTVETNSLIGRVITVNLMTLTGDIKKQNKNLKFLITKIEGGKGITELFGYYLIPASIRRLVRKGKKRIDLSFICLTSDKKRVRIKSLFIPNIKVKGSIASSLRRTTIAYLSKQLPKMTFENAVRELMNYKIQRSLKDELKRVYPIRILDISALYIEKEKKPAEKKKETKAEVEEKAPEKEERPKEEKKEKASKKEEPKVEEKEEVKEENKKEVKEKKAETKEAGETAPKKEEIKKK